MVLDMAGHEIFQIEILCRQFLQVLEPELLAIPGPEMLRKLDVQQLLYKQMFCTQNLMFAPSSRYQLRVLKALVSKIEQSISDPEEDVGFPYLSNCYIL